MEVAKRLLGGQILVSTVVSISKNKGLFSYVPIPTQQVKKYLWKSAAEIIQDLGKADSCRFSLQTVPAAYLERIDSVMDIDALVAGDDETP